MTIRPFSAVVCPGGLSVCGGATRKYLWVRTNDGCCWGCPQCGVWTGLGLLWVCCWSSGGGRVRRCRRVCSTSGTRLPPNRRRHRGCVCWPRDLCDPQLAGRAPPGSFAPAFHGCGPMMGAVVVVRNADHHRVGLVKADESAVFGGCLPRWKIAGVNFCDTASDMVRG